MSALPNLDVSDLPDEGFGTTSPPWWGTLAFMLCEGATLALCAAAYIYLSKNFEGWPPLSTAEPSLIFPTIGMLLLLLSLVPAVLLDRAAHRKDLGAVKRLFAIAVAVELVLVTVRAFEFLALNVRWDSNAYGSVVWFTMGFHSTLLLGDLLETALFGSIFWSGRHEDKHFSDASDVAFYWYFVVGSWLPLYIMIFLSPYFT